MVVAAGRLNSVSRVLRRVTDYSAIDPILMTWAHDRKLHVFASSKDDVVRSIIVYDSYRFHIRMT